MSKSAGIMPTKKNRVKRDLIVSLADDRLLATPENDTKIALEEMPSSRYRGKMNKLLRPFLIALVALMSCVIAMATPPVQQAPATTAAAPSLEGTFEGILDVGVAKLRLVLRVSKAPDGTFTAKVDSPDQAATDLKVDSITLKGSAVNFEMNALLVVFDGTLNKEGSEITGKFTQGGTAYPLTLKRPANRTARNRPQEPKPPYPYDVEDVSYENKRDGVRLAGTLTSPRGRVSFPAVILLTGSGAQDRNEEIFGHKPFLVLADYLTRLGIAVLRMDDRGVGGSTGNISSSTSENFAADALAGIEFLKTRKGVNAKQIGLIGHSEGGLVAPLVASQSSDVAFIVMLAGPGLPGEELLYMQGALLVKAAGGSAEALAVQRGSQELIFTVLKQEKDNNVAGKRIRDEFEKRMAGAGEAERAEARNTVDAQLGQMLTPWFRHFIAYDPRLALAKVKVPVLAMNGENDLQVPALENTREIEKALKAGGNPDVTIVRLPKLNHLFQTSEIGTPGEYLRIEETFAPVALKTIGDWIVKHTPTS